METSCDRCLPVLVLLKTNEKMPSSAQKVAGLLEQGRLKGHQGNQKDPKSLPELQSLRTKFSSGTCRMERGPEC